jgi:septal ring factor EnvC (AmiA/AmiB activator)
LSTGLAAVVITLVKKISCKREREEREREREKREERREKREERREKREERREKEYLSSRPCLTSTHNIPVTVGFCAFAK